MAYKFKDTDPEILKRWLTELDKCIKSAGFDTFIFFRDMQDWGKIKMPLKEVITKARECMIKCDLIIAETSETANGVYWEVGFFQGQKKPVIVIAKEGSNNAFLANSTEHNLTYTDLNDLKSKLLEVKKII